MIEKLEEAEIVEALKFYLKMRRPYMIIQGLVPVDIEFNFDKRTRSLSADVYVEERADFAPMQDQLITEEEEMEFLDKMEELAPFEEVADREGARKVELDISDEFEEF